MLATIQKPFQELDFINGAVESYRRQLQHHPVTQLINAGKFSHKLAIEFARLQYIDSVLWVPMLALMKDRVHHPRLMQALTENILCEAGAKHRSHITLCREFIESIGIEPYMGEFTTYAPLASHPVEIMNSVSGLSEAEIAGWILVAEAVVPTLFSVFRPCFEKIPGADLRYLDEHIKIDSDEHAEWMRESVAGLLAQGTPVADIMAGVDLGGRTALAVPDALYAKARRSFTAEARLTI